MKINKEINISTSDESKDSKNEIITNSSIPLEKGTNNISNLNIINTIKNILLKYKSEKTKKEIASEEILKYIKKEKIEIEKIIDNNNNYTIIQKFCLDKDDYCLHCMLLCIEKILNENEFIEYLLKDDNSSGMNIFEISSEIGELPIFRILKEYLKNNIIILKRLINNNQDGKRNIFHIASNKNKIMSLLFFYSFYYNNKMHLSILDIKNNQSETPLHIACNNGFYKFSQYLVNLGALIDIINKDYKTPLIYAVQSKNLHLVKYLIINGANKYIQDKKDKIAIDYTDNNNIIDVLENKSCFNIICKCKTQFESLKNHYRNKVMVALLIFLIIFNSFIIIKYKTSDFINNCKYDINLKFDFILLIINIIFEFLGFFLYIFFQIIKTKKQNNNIGNYANQFCLKENGIEYYEMFKYNENICVICRRVKEMNTKHCISCDVCIDEFDHHCFFLNACISKKNKFYFQIFVYEILITIFLNIIQSIEFFTDLIQETKIYYGLFLDECDFDKNKFKFFDFLVFLINIIYFSLCLITILISAIPIIVNLIKKKWKNDRNLLKEKVNSPLLPVEENHV